MEPPEKKSRFHHDCGFADKTQHEELSGNMSKDISAGAGNGLELEMIIEAPSSALDNNEKESNQLNMETDSIRGKNSMTSSTEEEFNISVDTTNNPTTNYTKKWQNPTIVPTISTGPSIYNLRGDAVSPLFAPKHLIKCFESLPIHRNAVQPSDRHADNEKALQKFVGDDFSDEMFARLADYCSPDNLCFGDEISIKPDVGYQGHMLNSLEAKKVLATAAGTCGGGDHLNTLRRLNKRMQKDQPNVYAQSLKYRSLKASPSVDVEKVSNDMLLEPGKELIYRIRLYRPFVHGCKIKSGRSPQFCRDLIMLGSQRLSVLRDNITCPNDFGPRMDTTTEVQVHINAKEIFPSGFLFINNVFYNDMRSENSIDYSEPIRAWAQRRGIGKFEHKNVDKVRLDELDIKLGYLEVYVHQGNCEHLFTISEVRLLGAQDQLNPLAYPYETVYSGANLVYCNTCAEFASKWVVVGSDRVPFDPAFLCSVCYRLYFYKAKAKLGDFKAYPYISPDQKSFQF